jgi:hypothetical protein
MLAALQAIPEGRLDAHGRLRALRWRVSGVSWDVLDSWLTQARSRIVDAVCGTEPEAAAVEAEAAAAGITDDLFRQDAAG